MSQVNKRLLAEYR